MPFHLFCLLIPLCRMRVKFDIFQLTLLVTCDLWLAVCNNEASDTSACSSVTPLVSNLSHIKGLKNVPLRPWLHFSHPSTLDNVSNCSKKQVFSYFNGYTLLFALFTPVSCASCLVHSSASSESMSRTLLSLKNAKSTLIGILYFFSLRRASLFTLPLSLSHLLHSDHHLRHGSCIRLVPWPGEQRRLMQSALASAPIDEAGWKCHANGQSSLSPVRPFNTQYTCRRIEPADHLKQFNRPLAVCPWLQVSIKCPHPRCSMHVNWHPSAKSHCETKGN